MEIRRHEAPFDSTGYLRLLGEIFGPEEAELERIQADGSENAFNRDIFFTAEEGGQVFGTVHMTVPKAIPGICGLSGLCTDLRVRGTGVGKKLFQRLMEEVDTNSIEAAFLGTNNPMASVLYETCGGFGYLPGTYTMARFRGTDRGRFFRKYGADPQGAEIRPLDAGLRIPVIPLLAREGTGLLLDSNTGIFNCRMVAQQSTMGLYPKFLEVVNKGGRVLQLTAADGVCGGLATVSGGGRKAAADAKEPGSPAGDAAPLQEEESYADFFCMESFRSLRGDLIRAVEETVPGTAFRVSEADTEKEKLLRSHGYEKQRAEMLQYGALAVSCGIWRKITSAVN